jgi:ubiquinone/menaquinone biosynthesis C-methylase UbiE
LRFDRSPNEHNEYNALAPIYDRIMAHVDYGEWVALVKAVMQRFLKGAPGEKPSVLEIGGGTGTLARLLREEGFNYAGSDANFAMCQQARRKGLAFTCCDGLFLPFKRPFDCAVFLYDGINYLQELSDYGRFFNAQAPVLKKGGLFLFDVTTHYNSMTYFHEYTDYNEWADFACVRRSYYDEFEHLQHNDFSIWQRLQGSEACYRKHNERHVQKVFDVAELRTQVPGQFYEVLGIWDNFSMKKWSSRSERVHFLLRKL